MKHLADYQMFWDCNYCGTKELLGISHRHCPNCGGAQDENARYFPPSGKEVLLENHKYYGVDWDCPYCSTPNSKNSNNCVNCGGPQDGSLDVSLVGQPKKQKPSEKETNSSSKEDTKINLDNKEIESLSSLLTPSAEYKEEHKTFNKLLPLIIIPILALIGFLIYGFNIKTEEKVHLTSKTWSRSIDIEEYKKIRDSSWCSSMPYDAYSVSRVREVRSHKQVPDGQTCRQVRQDKGDGSYSTYQSCTTKYKSVPVYDDRCHYNLNRWRFSNSVLASGGAHQTPAWPSINHLRLNDSNSLGNQRRAGSNENYKVVFSVKNDGKVNNYICSYNQQKWHSFVEGTEYKGLVRMIGGLICDSIIDKDDVRTN